MLNRVILIGRLTKDPEMRYTPSGIAVTQFTLACDRPFTQGDGEREADFIPIVTWRQLAETCANYLRKGRLAAVEGRMQVRNYENNEGKRVYVTEVIADNVRFLDSSRDQEGGRQQQGGNQQSHGSGQQGGYGGQESYGQGGNSGRGSQNASGGYSGGQRGQQQSGGGYGGGNNRGGGANRTDPFNDDGRPIDISEDDLPF